jgi:hypothetical protein
MDDMLLKEEYPEELMTEEEKEDWHHISSGDMPSFYRECVQSFFLCFFSSFCCTKIVYRVRYHAFILLYIEYVITPFFFHFVVYRVRYHAFFFSSFFILLHFALCGSVVRVVV